MKKSNRREVFEGLQNLNLEHARGRLIRGQSYRDLSTVCVIPTRGQIAATVVKSWWSLMTPMNQKFFRIFVENMEVGDAYNQAIESIMSSPELASWKYVLTLEEDNCPPPDGLLRLYESMKTFDAVSGLYWTKGEGFGQPMIYGDPHVMPRNYIPQVPIPDAVQECNGIGMGFALFKMEMFKKIPRPWFRTVQEYNRQDGAKMGTQDLMFCSEAAKHGYRFAVDNRIRVGHWDQNSATMF